MKKLGLIAIAFAFPVFAFAQIDGSNIGNAGASVISLINDVFVPLIFAAAFLVFIYGIFQYFILGGHDEEKRAQGRNLMIFGIIGFFVMVSVWGLVNLLRGTFRLQDNTAPNVGDVTPTVQVDRI